MASQVTTSRLIEVVEAVRGFQEKTWIPTDIKTPQTFFSAMDIWHYVGMYDSENQCDTCRDHNGKDFLGSDLRTWFPDLIIMDEDAIYPNVHMTLWGKDTCKCLMFRVSEPLNPAVSYGEEPD